MSGKTLLTKAFSVQSVRLVTCLICLLLTFPLVEQIHEDHCEQTALHELHFIARLPVTCS